MRQEEIWDAETAQQYDTPDSGMFATEVLEPTVNYLAALAGDGRALEFAIGTGRVAVPLTRRGIPVTGIELSPPMVERAANESRRSGDTGSDWRYGDCPRSGRVHARLPRLQHDLQPAEPSRAGCLFSQRRPSPLPGGHFVIELWVPELRKLPPGQQATVYHIEPGYIGLDTYDVVQQHVVSHHFRFGEDRRAELFRSPHRYIWPAELDLMAQLAGFEFEARHADWVGTEFTAESPSHVSVYRKSDVTSQ